MRFRELDRPLTLVTLALIIPGLAVLYSAGETDFPTLAADIWRRQVLWLVFGMLVVSFVVRVSPRLIEWLAPYAYGLAVVLLVLTLVVGTGAGTAASSKSWLAIGGVRIGQPAELAKLATILMLARYLGGRQTPPQSLWELVPAGVIVLIPFALVGLQPDLGSAIVMVGILFTMLFWVGTSGWLLLMLASPMISLIFAFSTGLWGAWIVAITLLLLWLRPYVMEGIVVWGANAFMGVVAIRLWNELAPYQKNRIVSFINPEIDPRATGWNLIQSKVAIGSGGLFGNGFTLGSQKRLAFLPAQHTDFIYPVLAEEFGFLGVAVSVALYATLFLVLLRVARSAVDPFSSMLVAGVIGMFAVHVVENIGMTVGLLPVTGIPLPFFSYGGSFLIICLTAIALTLRISRDARRGRYREG